MRRSFPLNSLKFISSLNPPEKKDRENRRMACWSMEMVSVESSRSGTLQTGANRKRRSDFSYRLENFKNTTHSIVIGANKVDLL